MADFLRSFNIFDLMSERFNFEPACDAALIENTSAIAGTHQIRLASEEGPDQYLTLRVDFEGKMISGDLFANQDHLEWRYSFSSETILIGNDCASAEGLGPVAICRIVGSDDDAYPGQKVLLMWTIKARGISELRLIRHSDTKAFSDYHAVGGGEKNRALRSLNLRVLAEKNVLKTKLHRQIIDSLFPEVSSFETPNAGSIAACLAGEKIEAKVEKIGKEVGIRYGDNNEANLLNLYSFATQSGHKDGPWTFVIYFSDLADQGFEDAYPYGRALGLDASARRYKTRYVALVFIREIAQKFARHTGADLDKLSTEEFAQLLNRIRFTIIHELGHLLNLPHVWQRSLFPLSGLKSNPADKSWMAYTASYPFGLFNNLCFNETESDAVKRRSLRFDRASWAMFSKKAPFLSPRFTDAERAHLYHAPFDQIAAGRKSYVDSLRKNLHTETPTTGRDTIHLESVETDDDGVLVSSNYTDQSDLVHRPLTATVWTPQAAWSKFIKSDETPNPPPLGFRFGSGRLVLLIRKEPDDFAKPLDNFRKETAYVPLPFGNDPTAWGLLPGIDGATVEGKFQATIPAVLPKFMLDFAQYGSFFTYQVVFITPLGSTRYSQQVQVRFERKSMADTFGEHLDLVKNILSNSLLPILADVAPYIEDPSTNMPGAVLALANDVMSPGAKDAVLAHGQELLWLSVIQKNLAGNSRIALEAGRSGVDAWADAFDGLSGGIYEKLQSVTPELQNSLVSEEHRLGKPLQQLRTRFGLQVQN